MNFLSVCVWAYVTVEDTASLLQGTALKARPTLQVPSRVAHVNRLAIYTVGRLLRQESPVHHPRRAHELFEGKVLSVLRGRRGPWIGKKTHGKKSSGLKIQWEMIHYWTFHFSLSLFFFISLFLPQCMFSFLPHSLTYAMLFEKLK